MPKKFLLVIVVLIGFIVGAVVVLPARLIARWLPPNVQVGTLNGSIWNGSTDYLAIDGRALGTAKWKLHPLALLGARASLDAVVEGPQRELRGAFSFGLGKTFEARKVELRWPVAELPVRAVPPGWTGTLRATIAKLKLSSVGLQDIAGVVDALELQRPAPDAVVIGSYRLTFDDSSRKDNTWVGRLQDTGGPMQVAGTVTLGDKREYTVEGFVTPRPQAPEAITNTLRFLGNPDAQGRRPFSVAGNY